jgi:hypothetical protein
VSGGAGVDDAGQAGLAARPSAGAIGGSQSMRGGASPTGGSRDNGGSMPTGGSPSNSGTSPGGGVHSAGGSPSEGGDTATTLAGTGHDLPPQTDQCKCDDGEVCCLATGQCFDPDGEPASCPVPAADDDYPEESPCASDAHCPAGWYCVLDLRRHRLCQATGHCVDRSNCGSSEAPVCGCDGVTYENTQEACRYGARRVSPKFGACGEEVTSADGLTTIACGNDDTHCPQGQACCAITGFCYPPSDPFQCVVPPAGTSAPCSSDAQCGNSEYCDGPACDGPGGCRTIHVLCGTESELVCGCDDVTYANPGCAQAAGVRIKSDGACQ